MNEHYDPSLSEVLDEARRYGLRAWLVVAVGVVAAVSILWLFDPVLAVVATVAVVALLVFVHPGSRAVFRVVAKALLFVGVALLVLVALARKGARL